MHDLFVYGSLMFDPVWQRVVGTRRDRTGAVLDGYRRLAVQGDAYPGLVEAGGHSVEGVLVLDVGDRELLILDTFEGGYYRRQAVTVRDTDGGEHEAKTYVFSPRYRHLLADHDWDPERFRERHLQLFLARHE